MQRNQFDAMAERVRNWGRWGAEDQRGTLNHIDPAALQRAAASVAQGKLFNLGLNYDRNGPQTGAVGRFNPQLFFSAIGKPLNPESPSACFSDDVIHMPPQCATQWDSLAHVHYDGVLYNGCKACETLTLDGALKNGVHNMATPGILSRGVLFDIARAKGVDRLPAGYAITPDDLNAFCREHAIALQPGDIVLVRTGHIGCFTKDQDRAAFGGLQPGVDSTCAEWLHEHSSAAICADNVAVEPITADFLQTEMPLPLHMFCLRDMGMPLGEMFDLDALAADCALDGRYTFLLAAPPLPITGGVGSPVNPLALK